MVSQLTMVAAVAAVVIITMAHNLPQELDKVDRVAAELAPMAMVLAERLAQQTPAAVAVAAIGKQQQGVVAALVLPLLGMSEQIPEQVVPLRVVQDRRLAIPFIPLQLQVATLLHSIQAP
jgi:hypothetical protein